MSRLRRWSALALVLVPAAVLLGPPTRGQAPPAKEKEAPPKPQKWLLDRALTVSPSKAPVPALRYRLFPALGERKPGNAVPIYLRFAHERTDARKKRLQEKPAEWNKLPLDKLPLKEVKAFLNENKYNLRQLDLGARRKTAEWNYTLDSGNPIGILLGDVQEMRMHAPLLVLQARVAMAERNYPEAIRILETGISFSQQVGEGPFLISALVGIALSMQFTHCLMELSERPDAPNLYWALAVIPRPLIGLRKANELEQGLLEWQFPELADLERRRTPEDWEALLRHVRQEVERFTKGHSSYKPPRPGNAATDPASKSPDLPAGREYLREAVGVPAARLASMSAAEVLVRYMSHFYHEVRDDVFKGAYLPYPQGRTVFVEAEKRLKGLPDTEAARLVISFLPVMTKVYMAQARLERTLAALQAIEALKMHAAANGGELPARLGNVTIAPVPNDPGTGMPFEYTRDDRTATLRSRIPGEPLEVTGLRFKVTMRK